MNELKHYGILGMKWGVRKDLPRSPKVFRANPVLTDGGRIKKSSRFSRLSRNQFEKEEGSTYAILNAGHSKIATAERNLISQFIDRIPGTKLYQLDMTNKVDLILPSMSEKGKTVVNHILRDPKMRNQVLKGSTNFLGEERAKRLDESGWDRKGSMERVASKEKVSYDLDDNGEFKDRDLRYAYRAFLQSLNDTKVRGVYAKNMTKKGYNAVSDDLMNVDVKSGFGWLNEPYKIGEREKVGAAKKLALSIIGQKPKIIYKETPGANEPLSTSSVIIFDRGKSLTVLNRKQYDWREDARDIWGEFDE